MGNEVFCFCTYVVKYFEHLPRHLTGVQDVIYCSRLSPLTRWDRIQGNKAVGTPQSADYQSNISLVEGVNFRELMIQWRNYLLLTRRGQSLPWDSQICKRMRKIVVAKLLEIVTIV